MRRGDGWEHNMDKVTGVEHDVLGTTAKCPAKK